MYKDNMLKPALIAGVAAGVASAIPPINFLNCACCLLIIGGGLLASYLYIKDAPYMVSSGEGALVGLLAGLVSAITVTLVRIPISLLIGAAGTAAVSHILSRPEIAPEMRRVFERLMSPEITIIRIFIRLIFSLFLYGLFSALGGLLGVKFFERRSGEVGPYSPQRPSYTPPMGGSPPPPSPAPPTSSSEPDPPPPSA
ncbi:MAG: hypothetical protein HYR55_00475 [Acidobacteria bacterium]|nr:hypothetical protein [Acidobacteriota bacterium]MBI3656604.1 hypothetical protein [Acidobacteriota bacterium]